MPVLTRNWVRFYVILCYQLIVYTTSMVINEGFKPWIIKTLCTAPLFWIYTPKQSLEFSNNTTLDRKWREKTWKHIYSLWMLSVICQESLCWGSEGISSHLPDFWSSERVNHEVFCFYFLNVFAYVDRLFKHGLWFKVIWKKRHSKGRSN